MQLYPDDGVSFVEVKGGTGAMLSKLKDGSLEACVALTEWCVLAERIMFLLHFPAIVLLFNYTISHRLCFFNNMQSCG
jgi:hypothetical protein